MTTTPPLLLPAPLSGSVLLVLYLLYSNSKTQQHQIKTDLLAVYQAQFPLASGVEIPPIRPGSGLGGGEPPTGGGRGST